MRLYSNCVHRCTRWSLGQSKYLYTVVFVKDGSRIYIATSVEGIPGCICLLSFLSHNWKTLGVKHISFMVAHIPPPLCLNKLLLISLTFVVSVRERAIPFLGWFWQLSSYLHHAIMFNTQWWKSYLTSPCAFCGATSWIRFKLHFMCFGFCVYVLCMSYISIWRYRYATSNSMPVLHDSLPPTKALGSEWKVEVTV